jgi:4-hydroxybenzoate polyprenyltransferase
MKQFLKIHRWWDYQLTIMLGFIYHITAMASAPPQLLSWLATFALFVLACVGIAGFGHLVNDYFDRETDRLSGAPNLVADQAAWSLISKTIAVLALAWLPWLWLPTDSVILSLLVFEFVLFLMYSMPVVRLKERGLLGPVTDSLYSYTVSTSVAMLVFAKLADFRIPIWFSLLIASWSFLLGLRQIIAHQIQDASRDERTGLQTFVTIHGLRQTLFLLDWFVFPGELTSFLIILCVLASYSASTCVGFMLYVLVVVLVNRRRSVWFVANPWKLPRISRLMFLNNVVLFRFYTEWFPILGLIPLVRRDPAYLAVAMLHIGLFNNGLKSMIDWSSEQLRMKRLAT